MKNLYLKISIVASSILFLVFFGLLINLVARPLIYDSAYEGQRTSSLELNLYFNEKGILTEIVHSKYITDGYDINEYAYNIYDNKIVVTNGETTTFILKDNLFKISIIDRMDNSITTYTCTTGIIKVSVYSAISAISLTAIIILSIKLKKKSKTE